jgi:hypothetical protein
VLAADTHARSGYWRQRRAEDLPQARLAAPGAGSALLTPIEEDGVDERKEQVDKEHPEKAAAEGREGQRGAHEEEGTDNETIDTGEHSDAPGPFGTG